MRVESSFLYWAIWFLERDQSSLLVFFLDTDQKISELVARLWRGWSLPRKRWLWWLWEAGRGSSMSVLGNTTESLSSVFPALKVCYL